MMALTSGSSYSSPANFGTQMTDTTLGIINKTVNDILELLIAKETNSQDDKQLDSLKCIIHSTEWPYSPRNSKQRPRLLTTTTSLPQLNPKPHCSAITSPLTMMATPAASTPETTTLAAFSTQTFEWVWVNRSPPLVIWMSSNNNYRTIGRF